MRIAVIGVGAVGARVARQLLSTVGVTEVVVADPHQPTLDAVARSLGSSATTWSSRGPADVPPCDAMVLAGPPGTHVARAQAAVLQGIPVVSVSDAVHDIEGLLALDEWAAQNNTVVAVGAGFMPGLSCVLVRHAVSEFDEVAEIHVAKAGTGGPACARQHHRALARSSIDFRDGDWIDQRGGSGRVLRWFPDPVSAQDCYRARLPDPLLLHAAFPQVERVTARVAATRRDRLTMRVPMLRRPHTPEAGIGGIRVEVWGRRGGERHVLAYGAVDRPAAAAGTVAAVAINWILDDRVERRGAAGLASLVNPVPFLQELATRGVKAAAFEGEEAWIMPVEP